MYRQAEIYAREGVDLERSTLADWVGGATELLKPLHEALRRYVMSDHKLRADDTPVPVLAPGQGKTKQGRLWTYVRDDRPAADSAAPTVWFAYSPDRRGEHPHRHPAEFKGTLQADAYAGFNRLYESGRIQEAACWAHVRRKFFDLQEAHASPVAKEALERIGSLYAIENEIRGRPPEERQRERHTRSRPLLNSLRDWFKELLTKLSRSPRPQVLFTTRSGAGLLWCAIAMTGGGRLIRTAPSGRCVRSHSDARIIFSLVPIQAVKERR